MESFLNGGMKGFALREAVEVSLILLKPFFLKPKRVLDFLKYGLVFEEFIESSSDLLSVITLGPEPRLLFFSLEVP